MIQIDIEMPKTCNDCPCSYFTEGAYSDYCQVLNRRFDKETEKKLICGLPSGEYKRQEWCPLKESEEEE